MMDLEDGSASFGHGAGASVRRRAAVEPSSSHRVIWAYLQSRHKPWHRGTLAQLIRPQTEALLLLIALLEWPRSIQRPGRAGSPVISESSESRHTCLRGRVRRPPQPALPCPTL